MSTLPPPPPPTLYNPTVTFSDECEPDTVLNAFRPHGFASDVTWTVDVTLADGETFTAIPARYEPPEAPLEMYEDGHLVFVDYENLPPAWERRVRYGDVVNLHVC